MEKENQIVKGPLRPKMDVKRLQKEGVIDMNKEFELPSVIQNIAIITS